jgi:nucleoside-diphosphate-sugar epimerase
MDPSHAEDVLGWRARIPLADGLTESFRALLEEFAARERT